MKTGILLGDDGKGKYLVGDDAEDLSFVGELGAVRKNS